MTPEAGRIGSPLGTSWLTPRRPFAIAHDAWSDGRGYRRRDLILQHPEGEHVAAILTVPPTPPPWPAVLYCHAHGNRYAIGCEELVSGRPALQAPPYAEALAGAGIAAFCLDMPCFGSRQAETESARAKRLLWQGDTLLGRMLADLAGGIDFLTALPDIHSHRIGALGLSMGATHAFWLGALDQRIAAVAQLCVFAELQLLMATGAHDLHGPYLTVPGLSALAYRRASPTAR